MVSALQLISYRTACVEELYSMLVLWLHLDPMSLSPSAAKYFHLVAPGPILGRIPKKGHLKKRMFGVGA
jgi:hypothetical protein